MLCLKKLHSDELLQIALLISILRVNQDAILDTDIYGGVNDLNSDNGTSFSRLTPSIIRSQFIHPKSLDTVLLNYERDLFADLNSLGRFNNYRHQNISAYLLNIDRNAAPLAEGETLTVPLTLATTNQSQDIVPRGLVENEVSVNSVEDGLELSQEDMDLIEVLWKQDVDLGFSLEDASANQKLETVAGVPDKKVDFEEFVKEFANEELTPCTSLPLEEEKPVKIEPKDETKEEEDDLCAGVDYTIDTETGEYVIKGETEPVSNATDLEDLSLPLPEFLLDEALSLVELDDEPTLQVEENIKLSHLLNDSKDTSTDLKPVGNLSTGEEDDFDRDFDLFTEMIQAPQFHHPHHRAPFHQGRMPSFVRTVSMEQRWQDLANLLSLPSPGEAASGVPHPFGPHHAHALHNYSHHHAGHHAHAAAAAAAAAAAYGVPDARGVLLHNATLPTPMGDLNAAHYGNHFGGSISNAVATSMNLTNSSEPMGEPSTATHYKMEPSSEIMPYYPNNFSEVASNQTDGFLSSILNDEDLQLMDMAMNEGMYTMRMLDANQTSSLSMNSTSAGPSKTDMERLDTSSDSAVSSMGSERVPSLSDGEWCDAGSDSGHTTHGEHFYHNYTNRPLPESARMPLVAQKKHQMYGKRYFQEQGAPSTSVHPHPTPIKYEYRDPVMPTYASGPSQAEAMSSKSQDVKYFCGADFSHASRSPLDHVQHNHTYHLPAENGGPMQRPISRDKIKIRKVEEEHLSRDEKRAKSMNIPITVDDIINLPMDEFNERLSKYDLSESQLSLIRDIRRRGKNKVAAQNCRKRKLDQIMNLADEVREMRDRKMKLVNDHKYACSEVKRMKEKFQQLYRHVFQNLRDPDGNQYSPYQYSLQTAADGSMVMVPKDSNHPHNSKE